MSNAAGFKADPKKGRKALTVWIMPAVRSQVRLIAAEKEMQQQELLIEWLNDGFEKYGKPRIAQFQHMKSE
jgi:hypothetical protein